MYFENRKSKRSAQALQSFGLDGERFARLEISTWVRPELVVAGRGTTAGVLVRFYSDGRELVGSSRLGPWVGTSRWSQRSKVWRDGWRNLHHPKAALAAESALEGERGACTLAREWADGADLADASTWAQVHGQPRTGPEALGWETPLEAYRPFLSYNELGSLLDEGPSKLHDALSKVLGLDALVDAQTALQQARSARDKARKDADQQRKALLARLEDVEDERARSIQETAGEAGPGGLRRRDRILGE